MMFDLISAESVFYIYIFMFISHLCFTNLDLIDLIIWYHLELEMSFNG